jgi:ABC-2 type transport system permease protein
MLAATFSEAGKLPAFVRRDFMIALSQRTALAGGVVFFAVQLVVFSFIGRLVDPAVLPAYGGSTATYMEFVTVGIILCLLVGLALVRITVAVRQEQSRGTLEALLATPAAIVTVALGSVVFELLWVPVRMGLFLLIAVLALGLDFEVAGGSKTMVLLLAFMPFVWGLGLICAAAMLAFRRGAGATGVVIAALGVASGAYFPVHLLPDWLEAAGGVSPWARALESMRGALLGGMTWGHVASEALALAGASAILLVAGVMVFRLALARERRNGARSC